MKFIDNVDIKRYREFESKHKKSHFLQSYEWGQFCKDAKGQVPRYVGMEDNDGNLVASCLILLRRTPFGFSYGYAPRGFVLDYSNKDVINEFTNYLKQYMKDNKIIYIAKYIAYLYILFDSITYRYIIYKSDIHIPYARTFLLILLYSLSIAAINTTAVKYNAINISGIAFTKVTV